MGKNRGFTLIEMLIVIAVIGVLAVAVLSAINPVEQMRKARDTRRRSNAAELLNGLERYYATNEEYPTAYTGGVESSSGVSCADVGGDAGALVGSSDVQGLIDTDELKAEFQTRITDPDNYLYGGIDADSDLAIVCYEIESTSNQDKYAAASNYCSQNNAEWVCLPE